MTSESPSRSRSSRTEPSELRVARLASGSPPFCLMSSATRASRSARRASSSAPRSTRNCAMGRVLSATQAAKAASSSLG